MHPLLEGLSDAIGFVGGTLAAYWLGRLAGFDALAAGYNAGSIGGIVLIGLGGGAGLHMARRWRTARRAASKEAEAE